MWSSLSSRGHIWSTARGEALVETASPGHTQNLSTKEKCHRNMAATTKCIALRMALALFFCSSAQNSSIEIFDHWLESILQRDTGFPVEILLRLGNIWLSLHGVIGRCG